MWVGVIPALLLTGAFDGWMAADGLGAVGPLDRPRGLFGGWIPTGASDVETLRVVATFSFLQGMHYAIWIGLLPSVSAARTGGGRLGGWLFGRAGTVAAVAVGVGLLPLFATRYLDAFSAYGVLSSFHALVEFPVLLAFLLANTAQPGARTAAA